MSEQDGPQIVETDNSNRAAESRPVHIDGYCDDCGAPLDSEKHLGHVPVGPHRVYRHAPVTNITRAFQKSAAGLTTVSVKVEPTAETPLGRMTKAELLAVGESEGADVAPEMTNAKLVENIEKHRATKGT